MFRSSVFSRRSGVWLSASNGLAIAWLSRAVWRTRSWLPVAWLVWVFTIRAGAVILWSDPDSTQVHETGTGTDILGGAVQRDDSANDTLYFKFQVDPLSDRDTEEYFAAFELFDGEVERLG